ncbi:CARDB domain-containing protein [Chloroflexota bacterium]
MIKSRFAKFVSVILVWLMVSSTLGAFPSAVYASTLPDLTVTSVSLSTSSVQAGGEVTVTYSVKNQGGESAD